MLPDNDNVVRSQRAIYEALEYGDFYEAFHEMKYHLEMAFNGKFTVDKDWLNETIIELQDHIELVGRIMEIAKAIALLAGDNNES